LLRPGRIDRKIEYKLATHAQGAALFDRFYPIKHVTPEPLVDSSNEKVATDEEKIAVLRRLNDDFTSHIPEHEFSTAELQGFLLSCKMMPEKAAKTIQGWVADERRQREEKQARIDAKKRKHTERQEKMEVEKFQSTLAKIGGGVGPGHTQINGTGEKKVSDTPLPPTVANGSVVPPAAAKLNGTKTTIVNGSDSGGTRVNGSAPTSDGAHNA
jgi:chaperone BCS1